MGNTNERTPRGGEQGEEEDPHYSRSHSIISTRSHNPDVNSHVLPPVAFQRIRKCLLSLPLQDGQEMKEEAIERVSKHVILKTYDAGEDVIMKGQSTKGIFMIVEGSARVMSEKGDEILANLSEGEFFGEISLIFDIPCTARVQADKTCVLAQLEPSSSRRLLHRVQIGLLDWFVIRRYLPTSNQIDVERCLRRMTYTSLKSCPAFEEWEEEPLKTLILYLDPAMVILYQPHTPVLCVNDPPTSLYVIIRGSAIIQDNNSRPLVSMDVSNHGDDDPVVIGEEGLHLGKRSMVSITTSTCCEVIHIKEEWIQSTVDEYPDDAGASWSRLQTRWRALLNKDRQLRHKYPAVLQSEVIYQMLKNSSVLSQCSSHCVQHLALQGIPQEFQMEDYVCIPEEIAEGSLVLVLLGELELVTGSDMRYVYTVGDGEVFCPNKWMGSKGKLVARSEGVAIKIDSSVVTETLQKFPDCILIYPPEPQ
uniref:Uncharacterized protein LOC111105077 n=1 Tax=Crassostrea virginica TaxID=6565 RepID=A0A8B8AXD6_CRAVI|nr:uncharacterized protein LOC111105077 [Crassostrea virginica]